MSEAGTGIAGMDVWAGLIEETRLALAMLRAEDLEALAARAEQISEDSQQNSLAGTPTPTDLRRIAAEHRMLGELLQATDQNLNVLRRLRGSEQDGRGRPRWER